MKKITWLSDNLDFSNDYMFFEFDSYEIANHYYILAVVEFKLKSYVCKNLLLLWEPNSESAYKCDEFIKILHKDQVSFWGKLVDKEPIIENIKTRTV